MGDLDLAAIKERLAAEWPYMGMVDDITTLVGEVERLRAYLAAISTHGYTTWADSSRGSGVGGQMITGESHPMIVDHLVRCALRGDSMAAAADEWERTLGAGATRLDGPAGRSSRRGPDGRPRG